LGQEKRIIMTRLKKSMNVQIEPSQKTLRTVGDLVHAGLIADKDSAGLDNVARAYDIAVTPAMVALVDPNQASDPIALQFIPSLEELKILPQERADPIGDYPHAPLKALVHRHENRVLLKATHVCAVYCRFCFRREMVGPQGDAITQQDVDDALVYIAEHREISEVILTGGDPLMLSPAKLGDLMKRLQTIPHIKWIRIHTRIPVVAPDKISTEMLEALKTIKPVIIAVHANHAREFTVATGAALARLANQGVVLLGQSVLLKGVNNSVETLKDLFETMMQNRIKPYYLHHPDLTAGTSHFRMSLEEGMILMRELRARVSGVCLPDYTLDIPGGVHKIPVSETYIKKNNDDSGSYTLIDPTGKTHLYQDSVTR
jgi:lysine 2,3-aminomutase